MKKVRVGIYKLIAGADLHEILAEAGIPLTGGFLKRWHDPKDDSIVFEWTSEHEAYCLEQSPKSREAKPSTNSQNDKTPD